MIQDGGGTLNIKFCNFPGNLLEILALRERGPFVLIDDSQDFTEITVNTQSASASPPREAFVDN